MKAPSIPGAPKAAAKPASKPAAKSAPASEAKKDESTNGNGNDAAITSGATHPATDGAGKVIGVDNPIVDTEQSAEALNAAAVARNDGTSQVSEVDGVAKAPGQQVIGVDSAISSLEDLNSGENQALAAAEALSEDERKELAELRKFKDKAITAKAAIAESSETDQDTGKRVFKLNPGQDYSKIPADEIDASKLTQAVFSADGWVCPPDSKK